MKTRKDAAIQKGPIKVLWNFCFKSSFENSYAKRQCRKLLLTSAQARVVALAGKTTIGELSSIADSPAVWPKWPDMVSSDIMV